MLYELRERLKRDYDKAIEAYITHFCIKQDLDFEYWAGDEVGTVAFFGDVILDFQQIKYDIDECVEAGKIIIYFWYSLETSEKAENVMNYKNWLKFNN